MVTMDAAREHRWRRSTYPLQLPFECFTRLSLGTSPKEEATSSLRRHQVETQVTNDPAECYEPSTNDQAERGSTTSQLDINIISSDAPPEDVQAYNESPLPASISQRSLSPPLSSCDLSGSQGTSSSTQPLRNSRSLEFQMLSPWTRSLYPSGATMETTPESSSPTSTLTSGEEHKQTPIRVAEPHQSEARPRTLRVTSPSPPPLAMAVDEVAPQPRLEEDAQSTDGSVKSLWKRQAYPLQSTAISPSIQHSPSPPPEEETGLVPSTHSDQYGASQQHSTESDLHEVQTDSLDSPRRSLTASTAPSSSSQPETANVTETSTPEPQYLSQPAFNSKNWHRQTYPLQAPAGCADTTDCLSSPLSSHIETENASKTLDNHSQPRGRAVYKSEPWHRQVYPLQPSATNLRDHLTPPESPERETKLTREVSEDQNLDDAQCDPESTTFRRQVYPLQSSAAPTNLPLSASSSPPQESGSQEMDEPSILRSRENTLATKVVNQWRRRQVYPLQSLESVSSFQPSRTMLSSQEKEGKKYIPPPVRLPKIIPAVTDAEDSNLKGRTIVVCLDGTGDKFDNDNSNIVHVISALKKDDARQMTYYQAGVGTYGDGGLSGGVTAALDMAVGASLGLHVRDAYHFLMHTYRENDRICIFGFSRGAYTARCLAGMIHKVGLLPPRNIQQISFAYDFYSKESPEGWKQSADFKKTFSIDVSVYFLGCFDSVASVGIIPRQLPLSSTPTNKPRYFRHAMALDERRAKFKVCRHQEKDWDDTGIESPTNASANSARSNTTPPGTAPQLRYGKPSRHSNLTEEERSRLTADKTPFNTDVLEVWFAGDHADIGGGAVSNDERHKLAQIPLRWMIRQAFECNTGILFKTAVLAEYGLDVHMLWPQYERYSAPMHAPPPSFLERYEKGLPPRSIRCSKLIPVDKGEQGGEEFFHLRDEDWTPEQVEDFYDAMSPLHDQLVQTPSWWMLEVLPVEYLDFLRTGGVSTRFGMNLGRYRGVGETEPKLHWTVLHRAQHIGYRIKARVASHVDWQTVV